MRQDARPSAASNPFPGKVPQRVRVAVSRGGRTCTLAPNGALAATASKHQACRLGRNSAAITAVAPELSRGKCGGARRVLRNTSQREREQCMHGCIAEPSPPPSPPLPSRASCAHRQCSEPGAGVTVYSATAGGDAHALDQGSGVCDMRTGVRIPWRNAAMRSQGSRSRRGLGGTEPATLFGPSSRAPPGPRCICKGPAWAQVWGPRRRSRRRGPQSPGRGGREDRVWRVQRPFLPAPLRGASHRCLREPLRQAVTTYCSRPHNRGNGRDAIGCAQAGAGPGHRGGEVAAQLLRAPRLLLRDLHAAASCRHSETAGGGGGEAEGSAQAAGDHRRGHPRNFGAQEARWQGPGARKSRKWLPLCPVSATCRAWISCGAQIRATCITETTHDPPRGGGARGAPPRVLRGKTWQIRPFTAARGPKSRQGSRGTAAASGRRCSR